VRRAEDGPHDWNESVEPTRVLLIDMAPMTREIIRRSVSRARDIALVGEYPAGAPLAEVAEERDADVVIFGTTDEGLPSECSELMKRRPRTRVLTVERNGRAAFMYELRPYAVPLGEASPSALLDAVRGTAAAR
jgi:DNA-binding NarL/FixJ family response regulator